MLKLTNYSKLPSIIFNSVELTANEKIMLAYLTNRSNFFKREEDWFGVPLCDFASDIGFSDHHKVSAIREMLKDKDLIDYRRGGQKKATQYKVKWENIESNLSSRYNVPANNYEEEDIPIPEQQKKVINFPTIPEGESSKYIGERFTQILQDNFVGDERFVADQEYQNGAMHFIAGYLSKRYGLPEGMIMNEIDTYKNNYLRNTYKN